MFMPDELYQHHQDLLGQIEALDCSDERLEELEQEVENKYQSFLTKSEKLHKSRIRYAKELNKLITASMHELSMEKAQFRIEVSNEGTHPSPLGMDTVCFVVSTNPGATNATYCQSCLWW